jgi:DNA-binding CsgD family transcriptional regulator
MTGNESLQVESLTLRERQMAHAVSRGLRNRQIANEFGISEETVKKHLATIYGKLALQGRVALAVHVLQNGLDVLGAVLQQGHGGIPTGPTHHP